MLELSDQTREELRRRLTKQRVQVEEIKQANQLADLGEYVLYESEEVVELPRASFFIAGKKTSRVPKNGIIISDPVETYLNSLPPGEKPKPIYVAKESTSLRTVFPRVNGVAPVEAVVDSGSQIISMAEETALDLGISWTPDVRIHMQSANNELNQTLGLARDVPLLFEDITLYVQCHVIRRPAYKILLGRPFDVVTESSVQNRKDGGMTITITDPNNGHRCTLPTYERGKVNVQKRVDPVNEVFRAGSRI